ncbi:hypothetical protein BDA99DRAFT_496234 [Phascolomyces articulosus]|uniref:Thiol-specific monooxygenase n=1 Tax=Phascolomyces articulosus TaxID=60185 RepID=A0AAD5K9N4_9FUNG|nr:hypothetical protein BDA99DRAFT_496234 [Phascolomyces articulosus]
MSPLPERISRVAVIGAGPGGLIACRALRDEGVFDTITVFERNSEVGGTWLYSKEANAPPSIPSENALVVDPPCQSAPRQPPFSAIYDSLHTNLPTTIMGFRDIPFPSNYPLFLNHKQVLAYLHDDVAKQYDLLPMIRFNTTVVRVEPTMDNQWQVSATKWLDNKETRYTELYDAVIVASGSNYIPFIPDVEGLKEFKNFATVLHSQNYRQPQDYANKTVLVVGNGSSSADLVRETSTTATKVYYSIRGDDSPFSKTVHEMNLENVERIGALSKFSADSGIIECEDGKEIDGVDIVFFATGYLYSFPFLPFEKDNLIVDGQTVLGIYEHMFYVKNPTLAFVGLMTRVVPMPFMQIQSTVIARYLSGRIQLPSYTIMQESIANETNDRKKLVLNPETEIATLERMGAWAEGYQGNLEDWQSDDLITGRLSEDWIKDRYRMLELRKKCLGY